MLLHGNIALFNSIALRTAKTQWSFGHSECNRVKEYACMCVYIKSVGEKQVKLNLFLPVYSLFLFTCVLICHSRKCSCRFIFLH